MLRGILRLHEKIISRGFTNKFKYYNARYYNSTRVLPSENNNFKLSSVLRLKVKQSTLET